jgi:hypothetical protein
MNIKDETNGELLNLCILSVPDESYSELTDEGYSERT